jgi:hypothetical protein
MPIQGVIPGRFPDFSSRNRLPAKPQANYSASRSQIPLFPHGKFVVAAAVLAAAAVLRMDAVQWCLLLLCAKSERLRLAITS